MDITNACSRPTKEGPEIITGSVRIDSLFEPHDETHAGGASITFEPGARTAWHTHPRGQILIVTDGCGLVQSEDGPIEQVRPGDVVWFPPEEKHWHGATPDRTMTHISIHEPSDGEITNWMEPVTDDQYRKVE